MSFIRKIDQRKENGGIIFHEKEEKFLKKKEEK